MFHITQLLGIFHLQQIFEGDVKQNPQNGKFTSPWNMIMFMFGIEMDWNQLWRYSGTWNINESIY